MSAQLPLSGVVIAKNEADRIGRCVASLATVCSEVWVLDSGSTDATGAAVGVAVRRDSDLGGEPLLGGAERGEGDEGEERGERADRRTKGHSVDLRSITDGKTRSSVKASRAYQAAGVPGRIL